ncbi:hypothetical protein [uncultured Rikenella sp.]|uniref:hypothetical protein n=1 Tax=uncultured Rikenella sp. TaxID=368003 RepID=UPI002631B140|nr:hypothetical protein [uncultured Rikenella sp.]
MNKFKRLALSATGALLISGGAYLGYLQAQPTEELYSDLTLANLEALGLPPGFLDVNGDIYTDDWTGRDDCTPSDGGTCGQVIVTPSGSHMEYLVGATHAPARP